MQAETQLRLPFAQVTVRHWCLLALITVFALAPRIYGSQTMGWDWDQPGSFTLVNFDEASSCRIVIGHPSAYERHVGWLTLAIADFLDVGPPRELYRYPDGYFLEADEKTFQQGQAALLHQAKIKAYCHSSSYLLIARAYSAVFGGLTALLCGVLGFLLIPESPRVGLTAGFLVAASGFHAGQSLMSTLDSPSVFFIYLLITCAVYLYRTGRGWRSWLLLPLLYLAITTKEWPFALVLLVAYLPDAAWRYILTGFTIPRLAAAVVCAGAVIGLITNTDPVILPWAILALGMYCLLVPWTKIRRPMVLLWFGVPVVFLLSLDSGYVDYMFIRHFTGQLLFKNDLGAGFAAIGSHKVLRNILNVPFSLVLGLGLLSAICIPIGVREIIRRKDDQRVWLFLLPLAGYLIFLLFIMTRSYYRHYLVLLPLGAIVAAVGFWSLSISNKRPLQILFFLWPALLGYDIWIDYLKDPRVELRDWYRQAQPERVFMSYYSTPPRAYMPRHRLFRPEYARGEGEFLRQAQYLLISENWYDTAFANELNGPIVNDLEKLPITRPEYAAFYREAISGEIPYLNVERQIRVHNFMPETLLHKKFYGTFQMFVGDLIIFRVAPIK
jgi:hypothetical protein